ncbi:MAG TPA: CHAT domain-containing protein, partial [Thermomicrobiales bacterium]|nr:CHAT domain-containing protein [Thermomicrobiales bacterium]
FDDEAYQDGGDFSPAPPMAMPDEGSSGGSGAFLPRPGLESGDRAEFAPPPEAEPPRMDADAGGDTPAPEAYALLECPATAAIGRSFWIEAGLAPEPKSGTDEDEKIRLPPWSEEPYEVTVSLHLTNFRPYHGHSLQHRLSVSRDTPYPSTKVRLRVKRNEPEPMGAIRASYALGSEPIGDATRIIRIVPATAAVETGTAPAVEAGRPFARPTAPAAHDLMIQIREGTVPGELSWSFFPKDTAIDISQVGTTSKLGDEPLKFVRALMTGLETANEHTLAAKMQGLGKRITRKMPKGFLELLQAVSKVPARPPSILIVTEEGMMPWELAFIPNPAYPGAPYLGAQAAVGRWFFTDSNALSQGSAEHPPSPNGEIVAGKVAVVWGEYQDNPLPEACAEAARLIAAYEGDNIPARLEPLMDFLETPPAHGLIHYAGHGRHGADGGTGGLKLTDDTYLDADTVYGLTLPGAPLVFLNACQAGAGFEVLGGVGGLVDSFIAAGAAAVVAPLWSVADPIANQLAAEFYNRVMPTEPGIAPEPPALVLREQRARFDGTGSPSVMAYQLYGHPNLAMTRTSS